MNLKIQTDQQLIDQLKGLIKSERKTLTEILKYLKEVEDRRLYALRGQPSLFAFCVNCLGYSEAATQRRISAMRLMKELPAVEGKLSQGKLSLTTAAQLKSFFNQEEKLYKKTSGLLAVAESPNIDQPKVLQTKLHESNVHPLKPLCLKSKSEIIKKVEGMSSTECERTLANLSSTPTPTHRESKRCISEGKTSLRIVVDSELMKKLDRLKDLMGPHMSMAELINKMAEISLDKSDPVRRERKRQRRSQGLNKRSPLPPAKVKNSTRHIPQATKDKVFVRDGGRCTYSDPETSQRCVCKRGLQYDHIHAYGHGGGHDAFNLRLRCQAHNLLTAFQTYGTTKMNRHLNRRPGELI